MKGVSGSLSGTSSIVSKSRPRTRAMGQEVQLPKESSPSESKRVKNEAKSRRNPQDDVSSDPKRRRIGLNKTNLETADGKNETAPSGEILNNSPEISCDKMSYNASNNKAVGVNNIEPPNVQADRGTGGPSSLSQEVSRRNEPLNSISKSSTFSDEFSANQIDESNSQDDSMDKFSKTDGPLQSTLSNDNASDTSHTKTATSKKSESSDNNASDKAGPISSHQVPGSYLAQIPPFLLRIYQLLQSNTYPDLLTWSPSGRHFIIHDPPAMCEKIMPIIFRHKNFSSFIRQLNKYDFHKFKVGGKNSGRSLFSENGVLNRPFTYVSSTSGNVIIEPDELEAMNINPQSCIFLNKFFQRDRFDLLQLIKRKGSSGRRKKPSIPTKENGKPDYLPIQRTITCECDFNSADSIGSSNSRRAEDMDLDPHPPLQPRSYMALFEMIQNLSSKVQTLSDKFDAMNKNYDKLREKVDYLESELPSKLKRGAVDKTTDNTRGSTNNESSSFATRWSIAPKVLLVEDDPTCRSLTSRLLQIFGCRFDVVNNGIEAVNKMNFDRYDIVLMDIMMPKLDGVSATIHIRKFDQLTPIISMTSNTDEVDLKTYLSTGMTDVLAKPFSRKNVLDILHRYCSHLNIGTDGISSQKRITVSALNDSSVNDKGQASTYYDDLESPNFTTSISNEGFQESIKSSSLNFLRTPTPPLGTSGQTPSMSEFLKSDKDFSPGSSISKFLSNSMDFDAAKNLCDSSTEIIDQENSKNEDVDMLPRSTLTAVVQGADFPQ